LVATEGSEAASSGIVEHRFDELLRREQGEVLGLFADADVPRGGESSKAWMPPTGKPMRTSGVSPVGIIDVGPTNQSIPSGGFPMETQTVDQLTRKKCLPCEGGVPPSTLAEARAQLKNLPGWRLTHESKRIRKDWTVKNFMAGLEFFNRVAQLAEDEGHHPDLHLEGYRNLSIEIWTHAIGGLSENDFILAAKIEQVPIQLKAKP